ncbi:unnamed protein product [marine sediment metagenome]|uniref:Uncharacterized protein n=1 Tax=marine sediment metagenome TaxID=412755 RepID=X0ZMN7_9ZZZZ
MAEWATYDELTAALLNQKSVYVGAGVPAALYDGQVWVDISTDPPLLKLYDTTNTQWMEFNPVYYETQAGAWANPAVTPITNGTLVIVYNSTQAGTRLYMYSNSAWTYLSSAEAVAIATYTTQSINFAAGDQSLTNTGLTHIGDGDTRANCEFDMYVNGGWVNASWRVDDMCQGIYVSHPSYIRLTHSAAGPHQAIAITRVFPAGVTITDTSLGAGASIVLDAGVGTWMGDTDDIDLETNDSDGWDVVTSGLFGGTFVSDGTNVRLTNTDGGGAHNYFSHLYTPLMIW